MSAALRVTPAVTALMVHTVATGGWDPVDPIRRPQPSVLRKCIALGWLKGDERGAEVTAAGRAAFAWGLTS